MSIISERRLAEEAARIRSAIRAGEEARKVRQMISDAEETTEVARELIGAQGHYIMAHGDPDGDGRQKYAIYSPNGELLGMKWTKPVAEAAVMSLIATGTMSS